MTTYRIDRISSALAAALLAATAACSTMPEPKFTSHEFPKDAYLGEPKPPRPYKKIGLVRTKVDFPTLDANREESELCRNYFNKAAQDLVKRARDNGGDAVIEVRSVVFLMNGKVETHTTPECSDDGDEGQVLAQGFAIRWDRPEEEKQAKPHAPRLTDRFANPGRPLVEGHE